MQAESSSTCREEGLLQYDQHATRTKRAQTLGFNAPPLAVLVLETNMFGHYEVAIERLIVV
jgi:hypothetical protein